jgi:cobyrinic acid a,c-diamide synthase
MAAARGLILSAPASGSGKTLITAGLCLALTRRGVKVAPAKTGPDYIDPRFLSLGAGCSCLNLDPWAMAAPDLVHRAVRHAASADLLVVEGVMGLFDGSVSGPGSTADLAATLGLPVLLIIDCARMGQSVAAIAAGFAGFRAGVNVPAVLLNRVASPRHEALLRQGLKEAGIICLGALPPMAGAKVPARHLGLTLPADLAADLATDPDADLAGPGSPLDVMANALAEHADLEAVAALAAPLPKVCSPPIPLAPLGQHMAIARDRAFAFLYEHLLKDWHAAGAQLSFFSPLADAPPHPAADAVFLPGGYPELHGAQLAGAHRFKAGLKSASHDGALIYGECGGFMVLGRSLIDAGGETHEMCALLPHSSAIDRPKRALGYRQLTHSSPLPWPKVLRGHEFHYASATATGAPPLFKAKDAAGAGQGAMGAVKGRVMGSFAHIIGAGSNRARALEAGELQ